MPSKSRRQFETVKGLEVLNGGDITIGGNSALCSVGKNTLNTPLKVIGGSITVTGTATLVTGLTNITSIQLELLVNASSTAFTATASISGGTVTISVWQHTSNSNPTPILSSTATPVSWLAFGN